MEESGTTKLGGEVMVEGQELGKIGHVAVPEIQGNALSAQVVQSTYSRRFNTETSSRDI